MLKRFMIASLCITPLIANSTITTLLDRLQDRPEYQLDTLLSEESHLKKELIETKLKPSLNLFSNYEISSSPAGMVSVPPNELLPMVKNPSVAQPFSRRILRGGVSFTYPLFIKEIGTLKEKASLMHLALQKKQALNLLQREAIVVGSVAQLYYMEQLKESLESKKSSIQESKSVVEVKVESGRIPQSQLLMINNHLNEIDIKLNKIEQTKNLLKSKIESLTGVTLNETIPLEIKREVIKREIFALKPLKEILQAKEKNLQAKKEVSYPKIIAKGKYVYSRANAYNNGYTVDENYETAGVYLSMPLYNKLNDKAKEMAKIDLLKEKSKIAQTKHSLEVKAKALKSEIGLLRDSIDLVSKNIANQEELRNIAKVSFRLARITQEEYLRYEDALALAEANLYGLKTKIWQDEAELAVIYGNDLKEIFQ